MSDFGAASKARARIERELLRRDERRAMLLEEEEEEEESAGAAAEEEWAPRIETEFCIAD